MYFYLAFVASGALGGLMAISQLISALANPVRAAEVPDILKGLGIDVTTVSLFAFFYSSEDKAKNAQLASLSREESLSHLKLRVDEKKIISANDLRGIAFLVICTGPGSFIVESFKRSDLHRGTFGARGSLVVSLATDGNIPSFEFEESEEMIKIASKRKRFWQLTPVYVSEWLNKEANAWMVMSMVVSCCPPWNAFAAQLTPIKGMWSGLLDGMDGRVL